jgi:hypothetical protein
MPAYFVRWTKNGIVVSNLSFKDKSNRWEGPQLVEIDILGEKYPYSLDFEGKSNEEFLDWLYKPNIKLGFFACDNLNDLNLKFGDEIPVTITDIPCNDSKHSYWNEELNICWATPD